MEIWNPPEREVTLLPRTKGAEDFSQGIQS